MGAMARDKAASGAPGPAQAASGSGSRMQWRKGSPGRGKALLRACGKFAAVAATITWQLVGYLLEAIAVVLTFVPAICDLLACAARALCGRAEAAADFELTAAYSQWLQDRFRIAFETADSRRQRKKVASADALYKKQLLDSAVNHGLLRASSRADAHLHASALLAAASAGASRPLVFVFTDIESSTKAQLQSPAGYQQAILKHDVLMRDALYAHRGLELDTEGDAFRVAFRRVSDAALFCLEVQQTFLQV